MDNEFGVLLITDQLLVKLYEITTSMLSIDFEEGWFTSANLRINASKEIMGLLIVEVVILPCFSFSN